MAWLLGSKGFVGGQGKEVGEFGRTHQGQHGFRGVDVNREMIGELWDRVRLTGHFSAISWAYLRERGINVNCVLPTIIDTPENRAAMPEADPARWVAPADLARAIAFLASDRAGFITGGGYLVMSSSAGTYAGGSGSKNNFGFNVKYNNSGKNLQGKVNKMMAKLSQYPGITALDPGVFE